MASYSGIIEYFRALCSVPVGQLPASGGTVMQIAPSGQGKKYLNGDSMDNLSLLFLCKDKSQQTAITTLEGVCNTVSGMRAAVDGVISARVSTQPNYVSKEGDYWIHSCIIAVKFYNTGGTNI